MLVNLPFLNKPLGTEHRNKIKLNQKFEAKINMETIAYTINRTTNLK